MNFSHLIVGLVFAILFVSLVAANDSTQCVQTCGAAGKKSSRVPYPFGFSDSCGIRLNCSENGQIKIGDFLVQNVTGDGGILVNLPKNCSLPIDALKQLQRENFGMSSQNTLLFRSCDGLSGNCTISTNNLTSRLRFIGCDSWVEKISCYSEVDGDLLSEKIFDAKNCLLFSSVAVDLNNNTSDNAVVSLEFQVVKLRWWLTKGDYKCHKNADRKNLSSLPAEGEKFWCQCKEGFTGDGFADGDGCRKISDCSASKYMAGRCGGTTRVGVLIGGVVSGAFIMTALALLIYCIRRRRSTSLRSRMSAKRLLSEAAGSSNIPMYPYRELERATNGFSEKQRLGIGAYGTVYSGKLHNDELVAIKKLKQRDPDGIEQVMNEIKLLSSVSHPNLVRLLGCCIENGEQILVYEYMPNGTLSQHLQRERGRPLPWTTRLTIATETAHAIAHLHSATNPPIYHRDIKSSNILLDYNFNSKVADFGLSRSGMTDDSHISTAPQGTPGYVDPQYHQNYHLSDKSDVYSFGVVLVEIITAKKVVDFSRPHSEINLAALAIDRIGKGRVDEIIDPFLEPNRDAWTLSSVHKVAELAFRCLAFHRDMRPSMMEVAEELEQIRLSGWVPLEENICMASSVASSCSSPFDGSEKSMSSTNKKTGLGGRRLIVQQRAGDGLPPMEEAKDSSPVSVQDPWASEESSPSTNSLLGKVV